MIWKIQELPLEDLNYNKKINSDKFEIIDAKGTSRGFYSSKNRLNNLTGKEWLYWTKSVINKQYPINLQHELRSKHGGQKPPELCADLIRIFTKEGQKVLDPFMGVGGVLLGASLTNRIAVGIEITKEWIEIYNKVCGMEDIKKQKTILGDSSIVLNNLNETFDLILTDVPYWNMDKLEKSKGRFKKVDESSKENKKSKLSSFNNKFQNKESWLKEMEIIFQLVYKKLKEKGYLVVFIGEMYRNGRYHFLPYELAQILEKIGYIPKANLIWYDVSNNLHLYGYLYEYIPSLIHQNILVFRK